MEYLAIFNMGLGWLAGWLGSRAGNPLSSKHSEDKNEQKTTSSFCSDSHLL